jgi:hypothetical protein
MKPAPQATQTARPLKLAQCRSEGDEVIRAIFKAGEDQMGRYTHSSI